LSGHVGNHLLCTQGDVFKLPYHRRYLEKNWRRVQPYLVGLWGSPDPAKQGAQRFQSPLDQPPAWLRLWDPIAPGMIGSAKSSLNFSFANLGPNPGPGHLPLDSGCGDVKFAGEFASDVRVHILEPCPNKSFKVCPSNGCLPKDFAEKLKCPI